MNAGREDAAVPAVAVVEDDASILDAVQLVLEAVGWDVYPYATGEAFLADLRMGRIFHCLLLDPHLPGLSGLEVVQAMSREGVSIPFVVLTAHPDSPVTLALRDLGARAIILKPVQASALTAAIAAAVPHTA